MTTKLQIGSVLLASGLIGFAEPTRAFAGEGCSAADTSKPNANAEEFLLAFKNAFGILGGTSTGKAHYQAFGNAFSEAAWKDQYNQDVYVDGTKPRLGKIFNCNTGVNNPPLTSPRRGYLLLPQEACDENESFCGQDQVCPPKEYCRTLIQDYCSLAIDTSYDATMTHTVVRSYVYSGGSWGSEQTVASLDIPRGTATSGSVDGWVDLSKLYTCAANALSANGRQMVSLTGKAYLNLDFTPDTYAAQVWIPVNYPLDFEYKHNSSGAQFKWHLRDGLENVLDFDYNKNRFPERVRAKAFLTLPHVKFTLPAVNKYVQFWMSGLDFQGTFDSDSSSMGKIDVLTHGKYPDRNGMSTYPLQINYSVGGAQLDLYKQTDMFSGFNRSTAGKVSRSDASTAFSLLSPVWNYLFPG